MAAIYLNGKLVDRDKAVISVYDHGFLYGAGVFEGLRFYNRKIFKLLSFSNNCEDFLAFAANEIK